jgi:hypothetical protein
VKIPPLGQTAFSLRTEQRPHGFDFIAEIRHLKETDQEPPVGTMAVGLLFFYCANQLILLGGDPFNLLRQAESDGMLGIFRDYDNEVL